MATGVVASQDLSAQSAGFESNNLSGWTASGNDVGVVGTTSVSPGGGKNWTVTPYGSHMARLFPSGGVQFDAATSQLGLNSTENSAIRQFMNDNAGGGNPNPTNAAWIKRTIELQAGTTYTFGWNYVSTDYAPFNDGSMMTLTHATNASVTPTLNNSVQRYALLGFTNPGTGNYSTGDYGSTGWQLATFVVPQSGTYVLGFATFNLGDTAYSPMLFIDELQGTTTLNGESFGPIAPNAGSTAPSTPTAPPPPPPAPTPVYGAAGPTTAQQTQRTNALNQNPLGHNAIATVDGDDNIVTIQQIGTGGHYASVDIQGNINTISVGQTSLVGARHYLEANIIGSSNILNLMQSDTAKTQIVKVAGNSNELNVTQKDTGNHFLYLDVTGDKHKATIVQEGSGNHSANIVLDGTHPWTVNVTQSGSTSQNYTRPHGMSDGSTFNGTCNTPGCVITIPEQ
jgi:hypothetical protein